MTKGKKTAILLGGLLVLVAGTVFSMLVLPTLNVSFVRATGAVRKTVTKIEITDAQGNVRETRDRAKIDAFLQEMSSQTFTKRLPILEQLEQNNSAIDLHYSVRLYVGGEYIQYNEDGGFTASGGYTGKVIRGGYIPDDMEALSKLLQQFYDTLEQGSL